MMTAFATKGLDLNFDGYTPTRYYPSPSAEVLQSTPADCAPWKELFDCTWRADLRVLMLRDLSAGRYGFQHHRIPRASASAARMSASPSYDIIYHIDMDADTLRKVAKDPGGVLDDPEVPSLFEVFERMRIWIRQDPVAKYDIEGRMDAEMLSRPSVVSLDKGIFLIPSEPDDVDQLETGASLHPIIPIQAPKRRRNTVSLPYSRPRPLSPRLRSHSIPNSPALSRPQPYRRGTTSSSLSAHLGHSRKRLPTLPNSVLSAPYRRSSVLYAKDYMRWMLGGFTRVMSGASLTLGVIECRGTKMKKGRITGIRRTSVTGRPWNRSLLVSA